MYLGGPSQLSGVATKLMCLQITIAHVEQLYRRLGIFGIKIFSSVCGATKIEHVKTTYMCYVAEPSSNEIHIFNVKI